MIARQDDERPAPLGSSIGPLEGLSAFHRSLVTAWEGSQTSPAMEHRIFHGVTTPGGYGPLAGGAQ